MNDLTGRRDFDVMMAGVQAFHDKHQFRNRGGEDMVYRVALMSEELGEIAECVTKGKGRDALAEECADLLILLMGNALAEDFDLAEAFWQKLEVLKDRGERIVDGRVRVTGYREADE